jgi:hypothetical protein
MLKVHQPHPGHEHAVEDGEEVTVGFYLYLKCDQDGCGFSARIGNATEFYLDAEGNERLYGHPVCVSREAAQAGIAGYWRDLLCWSCGRQDRESVRLPKPCQHEAMAWAMFPPPSLKDHPRSCPDCGGILCDVGMLQMFLEYRADPGRVRAEVAERLASLGRRASDAKKHRDFDDPWMGELIREMYGTRDEARQRLEAELKKLEEVHTEEEIILHRLGLVPALPVRTESLRPLISQYTEAYEVFAQRWNEMDARMQEFRQSLAQDSNGSSAGRLARKSASESARDDILNWLRSPRMKAKRELDARIEELLQLRTHLWVARRLLRDERGTLAMFRKRCPKCKAEPLQVEAYQT